MGLAGLAIYLLDVVAIICQWLTICHGWGYSDMYKKSTPSLDSPLRQKNKTISRSIWIAPLLNGPCFLFCTWGSILTIYEYMDNQPRIIFHPSGVKSRLYLLHLTLISLIYNLCVLPSHSNLWSLMNECPWDVVLRLESLDRDKT